MKQLLSEISHNHFTQQLQSLDSQLQLLNYPAGCWADGIPVKECVESQEGGRSFGRPSTGCARWSLLRSWESSLSKSNRDFQLLSRETPGLPHPPEAPCAPYCILTMPLLCLGAKSSLPNSKQDFQLLSRETCVAGTRLSRASSIPRDPSVHIASPFWGYKTYLDFEIDFFQSATIDKRAPCHYLGLVANNPFCKYSGPKFCSNVGTVFSPFPEMRRSHLGKQQWFGHWFFGRGKISNGTHIIASSLATSHKCKYKCPNHSHVVMGALQQL